MILDRKIPVACQKSPLITSRQAARYRNRPIGTAKPEAAQWNIRISGMQFPRSIVDSANIKLKQVNAVSAHRDLQNLMQLTQSDGRGNQHAPPDHRTDPQKVDL
jgi:hypothetical protein